MATQRGFGRQEGSNTSPNSGKNYLLTIGIDNYLHWQRLSNAVKDAQEFADVLTRQYQFEAGDIFTLYNEQATEANIYQALRDMKRRLEPLDNLIVYYSGHGHYDDEFDEGYWIPVNAKPDDESNFISNANIVKRINALDTQHTLLIVDSCFSGSLVVQKRNAIPDERFKSRRILTSGRYETVSDGRDGENSPFSAGLLTYLRKNTSPKLDTTSVIKYVKDFVFTQAKQHPVDGRIQNSADEGGEFVFYLRRDEEAVWQEVCLADKVVEYRNYIAGFPAGKYVAAANRKINLLEEDEVWSSVKINDTELGYEGYISKYSPSGKYLTEARERLSKLRENRHERQKAQQEIAARESERAQLRLAFDELVKSAERLFGERKLEEARSKYREALQTHLPGFAPTQEYLEEQINLCQSNLAFLAHYENGKAALQQENYRLAIEYFQEALKINNNAKVEKLIAHCQQQMQNGQRKTSTRSGGAQTRSFAGTATPDAPKRRIGMWIGVGVTLCFLLFLLFAALVNEGIFDNTLPNYDDTSIYDDDYTDDPTPGSTPASPTTADLLMGTWQVSTINVVRNGVAYNATAEDQSLLLLIGAVYNFQSNGIVTLSTEFGSENIYYSLNGNNIYVQAPGYSTGTINKIDRQSLQLTLPFTNYFGTHMLQFNLVRY
ncbi:caspase family protein [Lewinella sp. LCG006]|uniref:caspase family protein n=1 Tax=Lewinella sp. LCG006 TaxID=3231911 RepID=UPI00345F2BD2